jgi:hypothetical protein
LIEAVVQGVAGGGSGIEKRTRSKEVVDFDVFKVDFGDDLLSLLLDTSEVDLTEELLDCVAVDAGIVIKGSLN